MLRRIIRVVDILKPFGPLLARYDLPPSAYERIVVEVHLRHVHGIDECGGRSCVEAVHLWVWG